MAQSKRGRWTRCVLHASGRLGSLLGEEGRSYGGREGGSQLEVQGGSVSSHW